MGPDGSLGLDQLSVGPTLQCGGSRAPERPPQGGQLAPLGVYQGQNGALPLTRGRRGQL